MKRLPILALLLFGAAPAGAAPKVVASIVPVHAIVAAVMGEKGTPELLLSGQMSEHAASLSPQQLAALAGADLIFMATPNVEIRLGQISGSEAVEGKAFVALAEAPGVSHLKLREGGPWEAHDHEEAGNIEGAEGVSAYNGHVWLSPANAKAMAATVAAELAKADPGNAAAYAANAAAFAEESDRLQVEIAAQLAPVKDKPFIVFHDAYPYFEQAFGLSAVGSIADSTAEPPSAKRLGEIRAKLAATGAGCVFREPQFDDRFAATVVEDSSARLGVLDAVGADLTPGPGAYFQLMRNLAASLKTCLSGT